ncbi:MAG: translation initiation factor IF-3 [Patescibacteria group bacterium]
MSKQEYRKNQEINVPEVRLIGEQNEQFGVVTTHEAIGKAQDLGLDLVEVSPKADPPVCKLVDFGKMKYEQEKKERKEKAKQKKIELKGIRLSVHIGDHDFETRLKQANKFLTKGNKVKIELLLRGRQKAHPELGEEMIKKFTDQLETEFKDQKLYFDQRTKRQGGRFIAIIGIK